jgi:small subunit ribosomal protein S13
MILFFETKINPKKILRNELKKIYGIGSSFSQELCIKVGAQKNATFVCLTGSQVSLLKNLIEKQLVGSRLRRQVTENIKELVQKKCYRGVRHKNKLPVRGQRTSTNA